MTVLITPVAGGHGRGANGLVGRARCPQSQGAKSDGEDRLRPGIHPRPEGRQPGDDLTAYGCDKIFTDTVSGKLAARPELDRALAYLREGDVLVITRLSRAMRSLKHLLALADELHERGVGLVVLKQDIDTTTRPAASSSISSGRSTSGSGS